MKSDSTEPLASFQQKGRTKTIKGSVLMPETAGLRFVLNVTNLGGKVNGSLHALFDKKWKQVKAETRGAYVNKTGAFKCGTISQIATQSDVWVINLLCQDENQKTDVPALEKCLKEVCKLAKYERGSVHISSLLTSMVPELQELAEKHLLANGVSVYFYEEG